MGKQSRSKKPNNGVGKGKVTPIQVAFIVDRYLSDNNFAGTRSLFRQEAASLIAKSPVQEAPKSLLSLDSILNEYITLKEQKVILEQERVGLDHEKSRVHTLLQGMQDVMSAYNNNASANLPAPQSQLIQSGIGNSNLALPQSGFKTTNGSPSGVPMYNTPPVMPVSMPSNTAMNREHLTPSITQSYPLTRKRSAEAVSAGSVVSKRTHGNPRRSMGKGNQLLRSHPPVNTQVIAQSSSAMVSTPVNGSLVQTSSVAKCLFNSEMQTPPSNSPGPKTPPQPMSSQNDKSISPPAGSSAANLSNNNTPLNVTPPTSCTVISSERIMVSPMKNGTFYSVERRHCITASPAKTPSKRLGKRDHVKGRLDFDGSDRTLNVDQPIDEEIPTSESDKDVDIFDLDLPNLDVLGPDFSFSELLTDLGIDCEDLGCPQPNFDAVENSPGSSPESGVHGPEANQVMSEFSSTMKDMFSEQDMTMQGPNTVTEVKAITKCIRILSPAKPSRSCMNQELTRN